MSYVRALAVQVPPGFFKELNMLVKEKATIIDPEAREKSQATRIIISYADGSVVFLSPIYNADNSRRLGCHIQNADRNYKILPYLILMCTNKRRNLEDEKAEKCHFRIGPPNQ